MKRPIFWLPKWNHFDERPSAVGLWNIICVWRRYVFLSCESPPWHNCAARSCTNYYMRIWSLSRCMSHDMNYGICVHRRIAQFCNSFSVNCSSESIVCELVYHANLGFRLSWIAKSNIIHDSFFHVLLTTAHSRANHVHSAHFTFIWSLTIIYRKNNKMLTVKHKICIITKNII